jgi:prolyl-tRNA synthetase
VGAADTLKNVVLPLSIKRATGTRVVVGIPGDREVDMKRAEAWFGPREVEPATEEDFAATQSLVKGYIGPWSPEGPVLGAESSSGVSYFLDPRVAEGTQWVTGANIPKSTCSTSLRDEISTLMESPILPRCERRPRARWFGAH